ncbi:hypothetical protein QQF64_017396 [Cirrhinus molitorella]|uniref:Uncharacterized protein n=1 Tax=Cirrhinus molitorella TaxID=172907 RepID=A0ABR3LIJ2_9TELE
MVMLLEVATGLLSRTPNQSSDQLPKEVHYICRTQVKEVFTPPHVIKTLESDFNERKMEDSHFSQEDLRFISIMEEGVKVKADGHCELPLPFKEDRPGHVWETIRAVQNTDLNVSRKDLK